VGGRLDEDEEGEESADEAEDGAEPDGVLPVESTGQHTAQQPSKAHRLSARLLVQSMSSNPEGR
jgi:hypothetical protein